MQFSQLFSMFHTIAQPLYEPFVENFLYITFGKMRELKMASSLDEEQSLDHRTHLTSHSDDS